MKARKAFSFCRGSGFEILRWLLEDVKSISQWYGFWIFRFYKGSRAGNLKGCEKRGWRS
jgi:hypothetical protein